MQHAGFNESTAPGGRARALAQDLLAGTVAAVMLIANIVSFAALMFPAPLAQGTSTAIWAMLIGSGVGGLWVAWRTSLPPLASGMDSPTGAVLVLLAASTGPAVLAAGGSAASAVAATMLLFSAATLLSGALLLGLGMARWGATLRFVPHFVVAGFLSATGWLLIMGGLRMATGRSLGGLLGAWTAPEAAKLFAAVAVLGVLLALRRWVKAPLALPAALIGMTLVAGAGLTLFGSSDARHGWYLPSLGTLVPWTPLATLRAAQFSSDTWAAALKFLPDLLAVTAVALISLVSKTSSLEVMRKTSCDLDQELRAHGVAALAVAPLGGIAGMMQLGSSRLLDQVGGRSRLSGVAAAAVTVTVALANFDLLALIPLPVAAGLVMLMGYGFLLEALAKPLAQRDWLNLGLALVIMAVCVRYGYLVGVLGGVVAACLLFAASYARVGAVRQHLSRAQFAGTVSRSAAASQYLGNAAAAGESIQLYWLSGYIFFGSSEGVFERVRRDLRALPPRRVSHVVLDFRAVTGTDASATVSLTKLRHLCQQHGATLVYSAVTPPTRRVLARDGLFAGTGQPPPFAGVDDALAWCEDRVLGAAGLETGGAAASLDVADASHTAAFAVWLQQQLGAGVRSAEFMPYLVRHAIGSAQVLYREGEPADEIDFVAAGRLVVTLGEGTPQVRRVRSISTHTVVGEMGFFRHAARSATVSSDGPALLYTLTRANFESMLAGRPDLAAAFYECLLRTLADRIGLSERMATSLGR